jgi:hypothetical protein
LLRNDFVLWRQPAPAIGNKKHRIGLVDRLPCLLGHFMQYPLGRKGFKTAGIDHQVGLIAQPAVTVMTVSRETGNIRHDCIAAACQAVEKRRLPNIGPPDQNKGRFHGSCHAEG